MIMIAYIFKIGPRYTLARIVKSFKDKASLKFPTYFEALSGMDQKRNYTRKLHQFKTLGIVKF
jgi:hypothetical protein